jgi:CBS domain containing-hemolysin-like protein
LLELIEEIPLKGRVISAAGFKFTIETIDKRRIKEIRVERKEAGA